MNKIANVKEDKKEEFMGEWGQGREGRNNVIKS